MNEFKFLLEDRIAKIKSINEQYDLENNAYLSFSGGKDSTVLHYLLDIALPENKIPRIYFNTGIEYKSVRQFVQKLQINDDRIKIINSHVNIKQTLEKYGYPFKSKEHSLRVEQFNLGKNANYIYKYVYGFNKDNNPTKFKCPKILLYQFETPGKYNYSAKCCYKLKKEISRKYEKESGLKIHITGMRNSEGGNRSRLGCTIFKSSKLWAFHPLAPLPDQWLDWFIAQNNIELCELYYPPYNFKRTGCKGCPYALELQEELNIMRIYLPNEYRQCEIIWKPVYDEYRRIGYRLKNNPNQLTIFDFMN